MTVFLRARLRNIPRKEARLKTEANTSSLDGCPINRDPEVSTVVGLLVKYAC